MGCVHVGASTLLLHCSPEHSSCLVLRCFSLPSLLWNRSLHVWVVRLGVPEIGNGICWWVLWVLVGQSVVN